MGPLTLLHPKISHIFVSAERHGGVIYSRGSNEYPNIMSTMRCIFEGNSAGSNGGIYRLVGPNSLYSENNVYVRTSCPTGSVLAAESTFTKVMMTGDVIKSNTGNAGTINAGIIGNIHIRDAIFTNNTNAAPVVYISNSMSNFTCFRCIFQQNIA